MTKLQKPVYYPSLFENTVYMDLTFNNYLISCCVRVSFHVVLNASCCCIVMKVMQNINVCVLGATFLIQPS